MEKSIQNWVNEVVAKADAKRNLYETLKREIEETKGTTQTSIMIANSEGMSADQIHAWFPDLEVKWDKDNHIHIRW